MKSFFIVLLCIVALGLSTLSGCRKAPAPPPFDVPALIGLPIAEVTRTLGAPDGASGAAPGTIPGGADAANATQKVWTRGGAKLTVNFKPVSGRVTDLSLVADKSVRDGEQNELLALGRLKQGEARYSTDLIEAPDLALGYNGVRITPAPRTYKVQLRVTGPSELLQVGYTMSGATPPGENVLTIAPWDVSATLPDGATIQLSAHLAQGQMLASTPMIAEILVDGKVVASKKASVIATCAWEL